MSRPTKSVRVISKNLTDEEYKIRKETEDRLKIGEADDIVAPNYLSSRQKQIFYNTVGHLKDSEILSILDTHLLGIFATAVNKIEIYEKRWTEDEGLEAHEYRDLKEQKSVFFRCCQELCLSPQARAKMGTLALQQKEEEQDQLLKVFKRD